MDDGPVRFPPELPISARVADIATAIDRSQVVIVAGATGSGKTTQLPKIALAMGRGLEKIIGVTQPRRIAATSVAARVATELGSPLGTDVGYQVRFDDRTSPATYVKFMTDGILLAEIHGDPLLRRYDTLIIDEAHERSLTIDFLLGWVKRILPKRPDLKVIVSSATLETERFSRFFGGAPVIEVEGRTFPVDVLYEPPDEELDMAEAVAAAVADITSLDPRGDILVFLPGEREIRESERAILARELRHTVVQPLYSRLSAAEQQRVFTTIPQRRVILATNVAETSITIPGIVYVVDTGVARLSRYDARSGTTRLQIEGISQASADQRKGRCGRVRDGICVRLYDEQSFASRVAFTDPEILRTGLAGVILRMKSLGLGDVDAFPFLDPPPGKAVAEGYRVLDELGALDEHKELTPLGARLARFPVDPRIGRMILAGAELGCLREVLVVASALGSQDVRERPREAAQKADDAHRRFADERSDFVGLLRLWDFVRDAEKRGTSALRRACKESFLSFVRVREWREVHRQLEEIVRELRIEPARAPGAAGPDALHRALLTGLVSKVGYWHPEHRVYVGARQTRFALHPSSALAKKTPAWVMAFELVETTRLFARTVAKIEPEWLLDAAPHMLRRSYADPHWSAHTARAVVKESVTLFGLSVARDRTVDYATIEPEAARRIFIEHALVRGEYKTRGAFHASNAALFEEVARLRDKARRSDMLTGSDALVAFFDGKLPADVVSGKTFEAWRERAGAAAERSLCLSMEDVLAAEPDLRPEDFPDEIVLHGTKVKVTYLFDPSSEEDGVSVHVPLVLVPQLEPGELDWTVPGWHEDKLRALLHELPKAYRREIGDVITTARALAEELRPFAGAMLPAVSRALETLTGSEVPVEAFRPDLVAQYLRLTLVVLDEDGKVLARSRDADALAARFGARAREVLRSVEAPSATWGRTGVTRWDFGELPAHVARRAFGVEVRSYPALADRGSSVELLLAPSAEAARELTSAGMRRLLLLGARQAVSAIAPRLPGPFPRVSGAPYTRAEIEAFRSALLARIADTAFELEHDPDLPRDERAFAARLARGTPRLDPAFRVWAGALAAASKEVDKVLATARNAARHPSGKLASQDVQAQLEALLAPELVAHVPFARLESFPRYLKAATIRIERALADPRKDADKAAPLAPLWASLVKKRASARERDHEALAAVRWSLEELRVAIFAPELKTPVAVSAAKVAAALTAIK